VADQELTAIFGTVFPLARWESNDRVTYFHSEQGHVLDVVYSRLRSCDLSLVLA
jgi:hypothetical protein